MARLQQQLRQKYRVKDKEVKSSIRADTDKRARLENQMDTAQKAASQGNMKTLFQTLTGFVMIKDTVTLLSKISRTIS